MKVWIVLSIVAFAILPIVLIAVLGFRKRFEKEVFGRIYVWDKPWALVTQDTFVKEAYEKYQRRLAVLSSFVLLALIGVIFVVP